MTTLSRVVIDWAGASVVGRAVTVLHYSASDNAAPPVSALRAAFVKFQAGFPAGTTLSFPQAGDNINDTNGQLTGAWSTGAVASLVCTGGSTNAAAGVGGCITWTTGGIVNGRKGPRRLRGRTFLVPFGNDAYDGTGTLTANHLAGVNTLAADIMATGPLAIWHRPTTAGGSDGNSYGVQSFRVRDKVAMLRSRRD